MTSTTDPHVEAVADIGTWIVTPRETHYFDADSILAVYVEAQTVKTLVRYGLTMDKVNELIVFLDAHLSREVSE